VLLLPLIVLPYVLFLLGLVWFLAALGAFTRDLAYLMVTIIPILIFVTPVFYSVADLPEATRWISYLNPSAGFIEMGRDIILRGRLFNPATWVIASLGSLLVFYGGYSVFQRYRRILVDVI
jgi:lipopolysaccharide transport system permease protein